MSNFHTLEDVDRGSETQLSVCVCKKRVSCLLQNKLSDHRVPLFARSVYHVNEFLIFHSRCCFGLHII